MRWLGFMFRLIVLLAVVFFATNQPGIAHIEWRGYVVETSASILMLLALAFSFVLFLLFRLWRFILDGPRLWKMRQKIKKMERGYESLTKGFVAIAAGDGPEAGRLAVGARKLLGTTPITRLLQARAAQLAGDHRAAQSLYAELAADPENAILGYRGLIAAALKEGRWEEAERTIEKLAHIQPKTPWLHLARFEIAAHHQEWEKAQNSLLAAGKAHLIAPEESHRHQAAVLLATAWDAKHKHESPEIVLQKAEQAQRLAPHWLPAILLLATQQILTGHDRAATRLIERAWINTPHPELATLYASLSKKDPLAGYKQIERLTRANPEHTASQMALAEAALTADLWGAARRHLMHLVGRKDATQSVFRLLARLERRESGDDRATTQWLLRIAEAPPDPRWLCQTCGGSHNTWQAVCHHCGAFDTLDWLSPGLSRQSSNAALVHHKTPLLSDS